MGRRELRPRFRELVHSTEAALDGLFVSHQRSIPAAAEVCIREGSVHAVIRAVTLSCLIQSQYADAGIISPRADSVRPTVWKGSHKSCNMKVILQYDLAVT